MAVLGRLLFNSSERLDLADLLSQDSYTAGDFKYLIKSFVGDSPCVLKGFDIIEPVAGQLVSTCQIQIANSIVYFPSSNAGSFFCGLPEGNDLSLPLIPELRVNATNYIYATFSTIDTAPDSRAFWDPDKNDGAGGEFNLEINTESVLNIVIGTSVSTFPDNTIAIAKIVTDSIGMIKSIEDCRQMMFRLGTGGTTPNPSANFSFRNLPVIENSDYSREETPIIASTASSPNPFQGGDKNIYSLKEWMDAVMTKIKELSGAPYWYAQNTNLSLASTFLDTAGSTLKSKGTWEHDATIAGKVTWTADIVYKSLMDPRDLIIRQGNTTLANEQVAFIELLRDVDLVPEQVEVSFINGYAYVNGLLTSFKNLKQGDWIKKRVDHNDKYLRVENFYSANGATGSIVMAANALSISLSAVYAGTTESAQATYSRGVYENSDVQVTYRNDVAIEEAGGNFFWLAARSDIIPRVDSVISVLLSGTINSADTTVAFLGTTGAHGLLTGDRLTVLTGPTGATGTYIVEKKSSTVFTIPWTGATGATGAFTASYGLVTTANRVSSVGGIVLESAANGFESNETITLAGINTTFNGARLINVRSSTQFEVAIGDTGATGSTGGTGLTGGLANCVRADVRKPFGGVKIVQGESIDIGEADGSNIQSFIGMNSLAETHPAYALPTGYNTLNGQENFNASSSDSLTVRATELTAMMADRIQDRGMVIHAPVTLYNTTSSGNQIVTASNTISLISPKAANRTINFASGCTLPVNSAAYITIDREGTGTLTLTVESIGASELLAENKIILLYRLADTTVYTWTGNAIHAYASHTINSVETSQNKNITVFYPSQIKLNIVTDQISFLDTAQDLQILIPGSSFVNTLDTSAVMISVPEMDDGEVLWVRINRGAAKVFNTLSISDTADTVANGGVYITNKAAVPTEQDVFVLLERVGDTLLGLHQTVQLNESNIYEEVIKVVIGAPADEWELMGIVPAGTVIQLPPDSRDLNNSQYYVYGSGQLDVYLNGQMLYRDRDWEEISGNTFALSNTVSILRALVVGDEVAFRIGNSGGVYFADTPTITLPTDYFEVILLDPGMITAKEVVLLAAPRSVNSPLVWKKTSYGALLDVDYSVDLVNKKIKWSESGKDGLFGVLSSGDTLVVKYQS